MPWAAAREVCIAAQTSVRFATLSEHSVQAGWSVVVQKC